MYGRHTPGPQSKLLCTQTSWGEATGHSSYFASRLLWWCWALSTLNKPPEWKIQLRKRNKIRRKQQLETYPRSSPQNQLCLFVCWRLRQRKHFRAGRTASCYFNTCPTLHVHNPQTRKPEYLGAYNYLFYALGNITQGEVEELQHPILW